MENVRQGDEAVRVEQQLLQLPTTDEHKSNIHHSMQEVKSIQSKSELVIECDEGPHQEFSHRGYNLRMEHVIVNWRLPAQLGIRPI